MKDNLIHYRTSVCNINYHVVNFMSALFDDLREGLQEAIEYEKGNGKAKERVLIINPVRKYNSNEIKKIRNKAGMTQAVFAKYMGVSPKTVEAWELGRTHPTGPAFRLLSIIEQGKEAELSFVSVDETGNTFCKK